MRYVVNTHHHGDHSGSNPGFLPIAEVIAHKNARENMIRGNQDGLPRVVYNNETSVFLGGIEVQVFHLGRGHTNGDSVVYFPDLKTYTVGIYFMELRHSLIMVMAEPVVVGLAL
ncbi:MAG: hypothetical protein CM1200mP40_10320 [Gammaproteobacteria bacterium]|nr:MAG: hypothetical protein CM1200mP40_10320 [Gammaproteobacteria bacterium]